MSARKNRRVRGRLRPFFRAPTTQNISLLPKIVTEAHANLKKKKTSCNTTLKHYAVMVKYTPLERSSLISSLICQPVVFFSIYSSSIHPQSSYGLWCITAQCTFSPSAPSFYELKEGRVQALVRLVHFKTAGSCSLAKSRIYHSIPLLGYQTNLCPRFITDRT